MNRENQRDKDLKNTYLRVNREGKYGEAFEENLLYKQSVPGLLSFYEVQEEGEAVLVYGLNHKNPVWKFWKESGWTVSGWRIFIRSLVRFWKRWTSIYWICRIWSLKWLIFLKVTDSGNIFISPDTGRIFGHRWESWGKNG